jgi:hypothetical protein
MGWFSSDRTIRDYARDIWNVPVAGQALDGAGLRSRSAMSLEVLTPMARASGIARRHDAGFFEGLLKLKGGRP